MKFELKHNIILSSKYDNLCKNAICKMSICEFIANKQYYHKSFLVETYTYIDPYRH